MKDKNYVKAHNNFTRCGLFILDSKRDLFYPVHQFFKYWCGHDRNHT